jgi:hypothetical protein
LNCIFPLFALACRKVLPATEINGLYKKQVLE